MLLSSERRDERRIDQVTGGYFAFESSRFNFLLDRCGAVNNPKVLLSKLDTESLSSIRRSLTYFLTL